MFNIFLNEEKLPSWIVLTVDSTEGPHSGSCELFWIVLTVDSTETPHSSSCELFWIVLTVDSAEGPHSGSCDLFCAQIHPWVSTAPYRLGQESLIHPFPPLQG